MMRRMHPMFLAGFFACLVSVPQSAFAQDAKAEITAEAEKMETAFNARDAAALTNLYAEQAILMPPGSEPLVGHEAIGAMWASIDASGPILDLKTKDVIVSGDLAIETGGWTFDLDDGTHVDHGTYLAVWKKTDGGWKMIRDTWNSSMNQ